MEYVIDCTGWKQEKIMDIFSALPCNTKIMLHVNEAETTSNKSWNKIVGIYLNKLGVPSHLKGYGYLKYGIVRCLTHSEELESITKILYPGIAEKYNTTAGRVEHGIRHAIQRAWENQNKKEWETVFGKRYAKYQRKPTNSQFIASIYDFISVNH